MSKIYEALTRSKTSGDLSWIATAPEKSTQESTTTAAATEIPEIDEPATAPEPHQPYVKVETPVYRTVPLRLALKHPVFPFDGSDFRSSEKYRMIRTKIIHHPLQPRMIAISSAAPGDGKTVTSINLAGTLALKGDADILLIDADLRHPRVAEFLGIPAGPGLGEVLAGTCALNDAVVRLTEFPNLYVLPAGKVDINPAELLDSPIWRQVVAELRDRFEFIVVDTTPVPAVADYALVEKVADAVAIVVRPDHTSRSACVSGFAMIKREKLLGIILNDVPEWLLGRHSDDYKYYQSSPAQGSERDFQKA